LILVEKGAEEETQRLFFGLWPDMAMQRQLAQAASAFVAKAPARLVRTENLHCTLVFLGSVTADQRACVEAVADRIRKHPFDLRLDRFGYFRRPQVAWVGSTKTPVALETLANHLATGCQACGFPREQRDFSAHITIARHLERDPGRPMMLPIDWSVDRFALIESVNGASGVEYHPLRFWPLGDT